MVAKEREEKGMEKEKRNFFEFVGKADVGAGGKKMRKVKKGGNPQCWRESVWHTSKREPSGETARGRFVKVTFGGDRRRQGNH